MRKRFLRLTTAMAVVAVGLGCGMPAQAQLGGLVGGLLGGGSSAQKPEDLYKALADQLSQVKTTLAEQSKLREKGQAVLRRAERANVASTMMLERVDQIVPKIKAGETSLSDEMDSVEALVSQMTTEAAKYEKAIKAGVEGVKSSQERLSADITKATLLDGHQALVGNLERAKARVGDPSKLRDVSFQLANTATEKDAFMKRLFVPVIRDMEAIEKASAAVKDNIESKLRPAIKDVVAEVERDNERLVGQALTAAGAMALRVMDIKSAIAALKTNPGPQAADLLPKFESLLTEVVGLANAVKDNQAKVQATKAALLDASQFLDATVQQVDFLTATAPVIKTQVTEAAKRALKI